MPHAPAAKYAIRKCADQSGRCTTSSMKNNTSVAGIDAAMPLNTKISSNLRNRAFLSSLTIARHASRVTACVRATGLGEAISVNPTISSSSGMNISANCA